MKYWKTEGLTQAFCGAYLELRAELALHLLRHFGAVAAETVGEDSSGRGQLTLQAPHELVERCFAIADAFVDQCEERGEIKADLTTAEEAMRRKGELEGIASDASYKRNRETLIGKQKE